VCRIATAPRRPGDALNGTCPGHWFKLRALALLRRGEAKLCGFAIEKRTLSDLVCAPRWRRDRSLSTVQDNSRMTVSIDLRFLLVLLLIQLLLTGPKEET